MSTPDAEPPPGEAPPPAAAAAGTQPPPDAGRAAEATVETAATASDAMPEPAADGAPAAATLAPPPAAATADTTASEGGVPPAARDMSLMGLDIPIPSVSSIGQKKAATPPPTPPPEVVKEPAKHPSGVFSLFLTQDAALSMGMDRDDAKHESLHLVSAQKVFQDIKDRGPASEFYPLKGQLQNYWEPNFTFRFINDDRYLNNDNFEIYATYDAREKLLAEIAEAIAIKEEMEGPRLWNNLGSDLEVDRENVKASRPPILMRATRRRDEFYQKCQLKDRDALETWSSSQMECRPFKDPSFDKFFLEQDVAVSAISIVADKGSQTIQQRARNNFAQYEFRQFDSPSKKKVIGSVDMGLFLKFSKPLSDMWTHFNRTKSWICTRMISLPLQMKIINLETKQPPQLRSTSHSRISHTAGQKWCQQLTGCLAGTELLRRPSLTQNLSMKERRLQGSPAILMFLFGVFWILFTLRWLWRVLLMSSVCVSTQCAPCW